MSRKMVKLIHADNFFPNDEATGLRNLTKDMKFEKTTYGYELPNFNLIFPDAEIILSKVLGERIIVDPVKSGVIRKPNNNEVHYEEFNSADEWCFIVALEPTTINFWHYLGDNYQQGDFGTALLQNNLKPNDNIDFGNLLKWKIHTNIHLETNQCLFFRPWEFHSLEKGLIQYYRLLPDNHYRILVIGLPESSRRKIAEELSIAIGGDASFIDSCGLRHQFKDVDYSEEGQLRHAYRLLGLARKVATPVSIIDMTCPLPKMREILNPDILVWVSDADKSKHEDLNKMFVPPQLYDIECTSNGPDAIQQILKTIASKRR